MNEEEKRAAEAAKQRALETTTPMVEKKALPDTIPARKDIQ